MSDLRRHDDDDDLIEEQGMNAGPAVDEAADTARDREDLEATPTRDSPAPTPPDEYDLMNAGPDQLAGLPEQRPGYPGQQRSVDTG